MKKATVKATRKPVTTGRYMEILNDFSFKRVFGEANKQNLIALINDLLAGEKHVKDLAYMPTEQLGERKGNRRIILDLKCIGENGEVFLIEMQRLEHKNFRDRTVFSTSRIISNFYAEGDNYRDTALPEVYFIGILEFRMDAEECEHHIRRVELTDRNTGKVFYNKLQYIFLELPNFVKTPEEIETDLDRWFWLFKHLSEADQMPRFMNRRVFKRIFQIAELANLSEDELMAYNASIQAEWDWQNAVELAEERAVEKALKKERAKAEARERQLLKEAEADKRQLLKEVEAEKLASAKKMLDAGVPIQQIAEFTNLPIAVIKKL